MRIPRAAWLRILAATAAMSLALWPLRAMPLYVRTILITGPPDEVREFVPLHREHLRDLHSHGKLRAAGEFANGDGFLEILEAADRKEADSIGRSSPQGCAPPLATTDRPRQRSVRRGCQGV